MTINVKPSVTPESRELEEVGISGDNTMYESEYINAVVLRAAVFEQIPNKQECAPVIEARY